MNSQKCHFLFVLWSTNIYGRIICQTWCFIIHFHTRFCYSLIQGDRPTGLVNRNTNWCHKYCSTVTLLGGAHFGYTILAPGVDTPHMLKQGPRSKKKKIIIIIKWKKKKKIIYTYNYISLLFKASTYPGLIRGPSRMGVPVRSGCNSRLFLVPNMRGSSYRGTWVYNG